MSKILSPLLNPAFEFVTGKIIVRFFPDPFLGRKIIDFGFGPQALQQAEGARVFG
jgi:hypothetical protein